MQVDPMRFEYNVLPLVGYNHPGWEADLNAAGSEGWGPVCGIPTESCDSGMAILMTRPIMPNVEVSGAPQVPSNAKIIKAEDLKRMTSEEQVRAVRDSGAQRIPPPA